MGSQSFVYGYVETDPGRVDADAETLRKYRFDDDYPFTDIFSTPRRGYQSAVVSFAGVAKNLEDDWDQWLAMFEALLQRLHGRSATVRLQGEHDGVIAEVSYTCENGWLASVSPDERRWSRWLTRGGEEVRESVGESTL